MEAQGCPGRQEQVEGASVQLPEILLCHCWSGLYVNPRRVIWHSQHRPYWAGKWLQAAKNTHIRRVHIHSVFLNLAEEKMGLSSSSLAHRHLLGVWLQVRLRPPPKAGAPQQVEGEGDAIALT